jgi:A/G-specific adenine glycosylase
LMELGAMVCTPREPACVRCPLASFCQAYALSIQSERPALAAKPAVPHHVVTAGVIEQQGQVLIAQRPPAGLLGGMWEFPGGKVQAGEDLAACLKREMCEELGVDVSVNAAFGVYSHAYTHFRVTLHAFCCRLEGSGRPRPLQVHDLRWVKPAELSDFPMGKIDRKIAARIMEQGRC